MSTAQRLRQEGIDEEKYAVAARLLHEPVSLDVIERATGLSLVEIEKIKREAPDR